MAKTFIALGLIASQASIASSRHCIPQNAQNVQVLRDCTENFSEQPSLQSCIERIAQKAAGGDQTKEKQYSETLMADAAKLGKFSDRVFWPWTLVADESNQSLQILFTAGFDPECRSRDNKTLLMYAVRLRHGDTVDALLQAGVDVNLRDDNGYTALMYAEIKFRANENTGKDIAKKLRDAGAIEYDQNFALLLAAERGEAQTVQTLLDNGVAVDHRGARGRTPLMLAADKGHPDVVKILLGRGADATLKAEYDHTLNFLVFDGPSWEGSSALAMALWGLDRAEGPRLPTRGKRLEIVEIFVTSIPKSEVRKGLLDYLGISRGQLPYPKDPYNITLMEFVVMMGDAGVYPKDALFLTFKGILNPKQSAVDPAALLLALEMEDVAEFKDLLKRGANPDAIIGGMTILMKAAFYGQDEMVQALLDAGADATKVTEKNVYDVMLGLTALQMAPMGITRSSENRVLNIIHALLKAGADVNAQDEDGQTPLFTAVYAKQLSLVKALVEAGAKNMKDKNNLTPLQQAKYGSASLQDIVTYLESQF